MCIELLLLLSNIIIFSFLSKILPSSSGISTSKLVAFLTVTSEPGIAVPTPTLPVFKDVNAVPPPGIEGLEVNRLEHSM